VETNYHADGFVSSSESHLEAEGVVGSTPPPHRDVFGAIKRYILRHELAVSSPLFDAGTKSQVYTKVINETM
jgi:hypothetical protein